jgi:phage tail sheath protein FI
MTEYLAPGVYIEEVSFKSHSIEGVPTSTAAFAEFILIRIQQLAGRCT